MILLVAQRTRLQYVGAQGHVNGPIQGMHNGEAIVPLPGGDGLNAVRVTILNCDAAFEIEEAK